MNDIGRCLKHSSIITYADDTVLFTSSKCENDIDGRLNEDINSVHRWLNDNELILNLKKGKTESKLFWNWKEIEFAWRGTVRNSCRWKAHNDNL